MKKSNFHDYAVAAFGFYAKEGGAEAYERRIYDEALFAGRALEHGAGGLRGSPSEAALLRAERALAEKRGAVLDLRAVEKTMQALQQKNGGEAAAQAVRLCLMGRKSLGRGEDSALVHRAEFEVHASERMIYQWLAAARLLFARERGLRI